MMEIITGGRQTGKTTKIIQVAAEKFGYIICRSQSDAHRIARMAKKMGLDIPFPISYSEFLSGRHRVNPGIKGYLFDGAKDFLETLAFKPIFAAVWEDSELPHDA